LELRGAIASIAGDLARAAYKPEWLDSDEARERYPGW
jgi:hypothetical protein